MTRGAPSPSNHSVHCRTSLAAIDRAIASTTILPVQKRSLPWVCCGRPSNVFAQLHTKPSCRWFRQPSPRPPPHQANPSRRAHSSITHPPRLPPSLVWDASRGGRTPCRGLEAEEVGSSPPFIHEGRRRSSCTREEDSAGQNPLHRKILRQYRQSARHSYPRATRPLLRLEITGW